LLNSLGHRLRARYGIAINSHGEDLSRFLDQESMTLLLNEKGRGFLKRRIPLSQIRNLLKKIEEL
ncbi:MAG: hypothetical protein HY731_12675, partial [Candidatus Tectomicrobia bacterium]|nr:hypothetical protein [Candidatus Tectomicrobia bacterium]